MPAFTSYKPNAGYNALPSKNSVSFPANPDGTFRLPIWSGDALNSPSFVAVAITLPGGQNIWNDALQEFVFKRTVGSKVSYEFVWDNSKGYLPVGTISLHCLAGNSIQKYEILIDDNPFFSKPRSGFFEDTSNGVTPLPVYSYIIPTGIPANHIGDGMVSDTEFGYLDGLSSNVQDQLDDCVQVEEQSFSNAQAAQALENLNMTFTAGGYLRLVDGDGNVWHIALNSGEPPE